MLQISGRSDVHFVEKNRKKTSTFQPVTVFCPLKLQGKSIFVRTVYYFSFKDR